MIVILFVVCWIFLVDLTDSTSNVCPLPSKFKSHFDFDWRSRGNEWKNDQKRVDYFVLELSWSPTYCRSIPPYVRDNEIQCTRADYFDLVVHGLWPQSSRATSYRDHPRNCRNDQQIPLNIIRRYFCLMPDEDLIQAEWEKHGSCYYSTASEYLNTIEYLYNRINLPNIRSMAQPTKSSIRNEFLRLNPELFSSAIQVIMDEENRLKSIRLCYDLQYNYRSC